MKRINDRSDLIQRYFKLVVVLCVILFNSSFSQTAYAQNTQYDVIAVLMGKLVNFVSWPERTVIVKNKIRLCVIEDETEMAIRPKLLANNSLYRHFDILPVNSLEHCQVVFIGVHSSANLKALLSELASMNSILTFSAENGYADRGVMVNFYTEDQKVRFEINWNIMQAAGIKISSGVLKLARIVQ